MAGMHREVAGTDVLVVGAGPSGLVAAVALAQGGRSVRIVDAAPASATESRAALVHAATLEVFDRLGIAERLVRRGIRIETVALADTGRLLGSLRLDTLPSAYPFALGVPQSTTERVLLDRLGESGVVVERGLRVDSVIQDAAGCTVSGTSEAAGPTAGDPARWSARARFVVGADGGSSSVRAAVGIGFHPVRYDDDFVLADVALDPAPAPAGEGRITFGRGGVTVTALLPADPPAAAPLHRLVATVGRGSDAPRRPGRAYLDALLEQRGIPSRTAGEPAWSSRFRVARGIAERFVSGRVYLCGDAAHVHSPAAGQGMNTGIADAWDLAERMSTDLRTGSDTLSGYEPARRAAAEEVVRFTDAITRAALVQSPVARAVRDSAILLATRIPAVRRRLAVRIAGLERSPLRAA
jgi:2-polyprenyl-6-methoxyphenol hydroxylase-like FAD-dependent oxidoreductase